MFLVGSIRFLGLEVLMGIGEEVFFGVGGVMAVGGVFFKRVGVLVGVWSSIFLGIEMSGIVEGLLF